MATKIKSIVRFVDVPAGATVALPHGLNIDPPGGAGGPEPQVPDEVLPGKPGFTITADDTNVTVTNNTAVARSIDCRCEYWNTPGRAFGAASILELVPRPFIPDFGDALNEGSAVLGFGAGEIGNGIGFDYLWPWFDQDIQNQGGEAGVPIEMPMPRAGTIRNLTVLHNNPNGNGAPVVYTLHVNGAPTAVAVAVSSSIAGPSTNLVNSVVVALGDKVSLIASRAGSISEGDLEIVATMRFDA
jgi:hypothetical protein